MGDSKEDELARFLSSGINKVEKMSPSLAPSQTRSPVLRVTVPLSNQRRPSKQRTASHLRRNITLVVLTIVIIGSALVGLQRQNQGSITQPTTITSRAMTASSPATSTSAEGASTALGQISTIDMGQAVTVTAADGSQVQLAFLDVKLAQTFMGQTPRPDHEFVVIDYSMRNLSNSPVHTTLGTFDLNTGEDTPYTPVLFYPSVDLGPGRSTTSSILFEIPNSATPLELRYYPTITATPEFVVGLSP